MGGLRQKSKTDLIFGLLVDRNKELLINIFNTIKIRALYVHFHSGIILLPGQSDILQEENIHEIKYIKVAFVDEIGL